MTTETTTDTSTEDTSGLKTKNADLVRRLKAAEARAEAAEQEAENALDNASTAAGDELSKLQRAYNKLEKQLGDLTTERDAFKADLRTTRVDGEVAKAIAAGNVRPELMGAVEALLLRQATYDDEAKTATIQGKTIADFANEYFATKEGGVFVKAVDSSGSGSTGSTTASKAPRMNKDNFNYTEFGKIQLENPEEANAIADSIGRPDLKMSV